MAVPTCLRCGNPSADDAAVLCLSCHNMARAAAARLMDDAPVSRARFLPFAVSRGNLAEIAGDWGWRAAREAGDTARAEIFAACHRSGRLSEAGEYLSRGWSLAEIERDLAAGETWVATLGAAQKRWL